jgi:peptidoglycan/LPS O-acetylase OafA/YrhL
VTTLTSVNSSKTIGRSHLHIPGLDGLRGVAILAVICAHFGGGHSSAHGVVQFLSNFAETGWIGVDLFFVLSGFLITGILLDTADQKKRIRNFYVRRTLRIFPLFYGVLLGLLLLTPVLHLHWKTGHLLFFFFLTNMIPILAPGLPPPSNGVFLVHLWSLAVEEQFYLLWPFIVWLMKDRDKLLRVSIGIIILALILRIVLVFESTNSFIVYTILPTRADSLICGGVLALLVRTSSTLLTLVKWILPVSAMLVVSIFIIAGSGSHATPIVATAGYTIIAILCSCIVYRSYQGVGLIAQISNQSWLRFFGRYSYGLYIYHGLLVTLMLPLLYPTQRLVHSTSFGGILYTVIALGLSLALAMASYHFIEAPILKYKKRFA